MPHLDVDAGLQTKCLTFPHTLRANSCLKRSSSTGTYPLIPHSTYIIASGVSNTGHYVESCKRVRLFVPYTYHVCPTIVVDPFPQALLIPSQLIKSRGMVSQ